MVVLLACTCDAMMWESHAAGSGTRTDLFSHIFFSMSHVEAGARPRGTARAMVWLKGGETICNK